MVASSKHTIASLPANYLCEYMHNMRIHDQKPTLGSLTWQFVLFSLRVGTVFSIINRIPASLSAADDLSKIASATGDRGLETRAQKSEVKNRGNPGELNIGFGWHFCSTLS